ncbi:RDD family protein [compost metagenome]
MKTISFTTSQFVTIDYELASPVYRAVAAFLDLIFLLIYMLIASYVISMNLLDLDFNSIQNRWSIMSIFLLRLPWLLYSPVIEYLTNGRSLGKLIMGIRVVKSNGETAGLREYFTRWIFRIVDIWVGGFGFLALLVAGTTEKRQRIGDIMADTVVIKVRDTQLYSLKDVLSIKSSDNHVPTYPHVIRFSDEDMLLIKNTILRVQRYPNQENKNFAIELADETARLIGLQETPQKRMEFLKTVLQDYVVLTR